MKRWIALGLTAVATASVWVGCGGAPGERELRAAEREMRQGNFVRARALLEKSINRRAGHETNAAAYNLLGIACWSIRQFEAADAAFENSRRLAPTRSEPAYNLAVVRLQAGDAARAAALLEEAARLDPRDPRPLEMLGVLNLERRQWAEGRRALFAALERAPQSARLLTAIAVADYNAGDFGHAISELMQALGTQADYAPALYNLGLIYLQGVHDRAQAEAFFRQFLGVAEKDPRAPVVRRLMEGLSPPPPKPSVLVHAATNRPAGQPHTAEERLKDGQAAAQRGDGRQALRLLLEAAELARRAGDGALRDRALRSATGLCPEEAEAHLARGRCQLEQGDAAGALASFKTAAGLNPKLAAAQLGLAEAALQVGESDAALVALKQAVRLEPANAEALWALALVYDQTLRLTEKAAEAYRQFARQFPGDTRVLRANERAKQLESPKPPAPPPAPSITGAPPVEVQPPETRPPAPPPAAPARHLDIKPSWFRSPRAAVQAFNRGIVYQEQEDWERAVHYYRQALANDDRFAKAYFNLGTVYWAKGDADLAKEAYQKAIEIGPSQFNAMYNLAVIYNELNDRDSAVQEIRALLRVQPDYAPAHYFMGTILSEDRRTWELARQHYRRFLELAPEDPATGTVRQWLEAHPE